MARPHTKILFCFDFDGTITVEDSYSSLTKLLPGREVPDHIASIGEKGQAFWLEEANALWRYIRDDLGLSVEAIKQNTEAVPLIEGMIDVLKRVHELGHDIIIVSDGYEMFLEWILAHNDIKRLIRSVFCNPMSVDANGYATVRPFGKQSHCQLSTMYMCKGAVIKEFIKQRSSEGVTYGKVVYAGDDLNDLCPSLSCDVVLPRFGSKLHTLVTDEHFQLRASVRDWQDGHEFLVKVKDILTKA